MDILEEIGISEEELELVKNWCDDADERVYEDPYFSPEVFFEFEGTNVHNIFYDTTARFDLDIEEAVKEYGIDNIRFFCEQVLDKS